MAVSTIAMLPYKFLCKNRSHLNKVLNFRIKSRSLCNRQNQQEEQSSTKETEIVIPKRIHRSSTAILEALAKTVQRDLTAPHYKYVDDPFFIPTSNVSKRSYALAKESGRKAARWIFEQNPKLFEIVDADPKIEVFEPQQEFNEETDVTPSTLQDYIDTSKVAAAIKVYDLMTKKGIEITPELKQSLLEMLCFYNCKDSNTDTTEDEKWYKQSSDVERRKTWMDDGLHEQIFNDMEQKTPEAYCSMIRGMAKYYQVDRAYSLYQEMQEKGLPIDVETYNHLITLSIFLRDSANLRWQLCEEFLRNMAENGIVPNLVTFNSVLEVLSKLGLWRNVKKIALETFGEMKMLGIEPSLASYYFILNIYCKNKGLISTILYDIMKEIEGKEFEIRDPRDTNFFLAAMSVCHAHLMDKNVALKLHGLLHLGKNYALIGDSLKESVFYQHMYKILCFAEDIDKFFEFYNQYTPSVYTPEPSVLLEIIQAIELNCAWKYIPQIWTDTVMFEQVSREMLINKILSIIAENQLDEQELQKQFVAIAWDIKERIDEQKTGRIRTQISWTGELLGNVLQTCLNGKEYEKAWEILMKASSEQSSIVGFMDVKIILNYLKSCVQINDIQRAMFCLRYISDAGLSDEKFAEIVFQLPLTEMEQSKVQHLLGNSEMGAKTATKDETI